MQTFNIRYINRQGKTKTSKVTASTTDDAVDVFLGYTSSKINCKKLVSCLPEADKVQLPRSNRSIEDLLG